MPLLLLGAAGCSLLIPLDYTGGVVAGGAAGKGTAGDVAVAGTVGQGGGVGGSTSGTGGTAGQVTTGGVAGTGLAANGGTGEGGSGDAGTGDTGGAPYGGVGAEAGAGEGGETSGGKGGTAGTAGGGMGGTAGGGMGGTAGGGMGGTAGSGAGAGGGCAGARPNSDPASCGPCGVVCAEGDECIRGQCVASPCDGLCTDITSVTLAPGQNYKRENLTLEPVCLEVVGYDASPQDPSFVCWNMNGRSTRLNGTNWNCDGMGHVITIGQRKGGYCVNVTQGTVGNQFPGFEFPN